MASNNSGRQNRLTVPEAKQAMNNMKFEIANELGVNLKQGYNGDLTSRENGYVGGYMVKRMIEQQERSMMGK
ncbi:alpha/beta-type small acid-soluble spore protein [Gehongia tenuis]|uniref:Alpha/beta-type small acid-soluble spore protein n=1 Tax=Gehongia tenuis TaxID=2763655 RepID=A0A926HNM8_9FIRM|nr:alpha/beta-type small acid-soluble spore protein [Gehongia tenuis]MBC8530779.1 alpha/beta-type small acid-soluble spore protein [Gehongia tenuis]